VDEDGWVRVGALTQLGDDTAARVDLDDYAICVARSKGKVSALKDECSHGQVPLSEGEVEDGFVECWMHGSRFDLVTGVPTGPPALTPVPVYPVRVVDGFIEVQLQSGGDEVVAHA
jgi:3-phenylpropionate/trans-cinnamate dioxygenase ferredoxin subunit